jgi:hypothetical protein
MKKTSIYWVLGIMIVLCGSIFLITTIYKTNQAHTSFDSYYAFRGCTTLIEKTDTYGTCTIGNGQQIKMVLFEGKWYLDGDLPTHWGNFTF